jgi:hypothetical protein
MDESEEQTLLDEAARALPAEAIALIKAKPREERLALLRALVQVRRRAARRAPPAARRAAPAAAAWRPAPARPRPLRAPARPPFAATCAPVALPPHPLQAVEVEYGPLAPADWAAVRAAPAAWGFKPSDLPDASFDVTQAISLAAYGSGGGGGGGRQLAGVLVATLEPLQRARRQQVRGALKGGVGRGRAAMP